MWTSAPWWHWLSMAAMWAVILVSAIWATTRLFPAGSRTSPARVTLDERLARGELDVDEYRRLRQELSVAGQEPRT